MERKGFPESFDRKAILRFLSSIKAGEANVVAPVYDHLVYDIVEGREIVVDRPDILIFEGINVLQVHDPAERWADGAVRLRLLRLLDLHRCRGADHPELVRRAVLQVARDGVPRARQLLRAPTPNCPRRRRGGPPSGCGDTINAVNLRENILPTRPRADVVLGKGEDHRVERVSLRRL